MVKPVCNSSPFSVSLITIFALSLMIPVCHFVIAETEGLVDTSDHCLLQHICCPSIFSIKKPNTRTLYVLNFQHCWEFRFSIMILFLSRSPIPCLLCFWTALLYLQVIFVEYALTLALEMVSMYVSYQYRLVLEIQPAYLCKCCKLALADFILVLPFQISY